MIGSETARILRAVAVALAAAGCLPSAICAQLYSGISPTSASSLSASRQLETVKDIVTGNNTCGPYLLSWKLIPAERESVAIDGRRCIRGIDYAIDAAKGQITFTRPLRAASLASIEYPLNPETSQRNNGLSLPIAFDLLNTDRSKLQFSALYKQTAAGAGSPGATIWGLKGDYKLAPKSQVSSSLYFGSGNPGGLLRQSAGTIGTTTSIGQALVSGSYSFAGSAFLGAQDYGYKAGQASQVLELNYAPQESRLSYSASYNRIWQDAASADRTVTVSHRLGYNLSNNTQFAFNRLRSSRDLLGVASDMLTDVYVIRHRLGARTAAQFTHTRAESWGSARDTVSSQHLSVNTSILTGVNAAANWQTVKSVASGESSALDVSVKASPVEALSVEANASSKNSRLTGLDNSGGVRLTALPNSKIRISVGVSDRATVAEYSRTRDLRLEANPSSKLSVLGGYGFSQKGASDITTMDVKAVAVPSKYLRADGFYKTRDLGEQNLDTTAFNVNLTPWQCFALTAGISENPEDVNGLVQYFETRSLGVKANVGILSLSGDYTLKDEYRIGRRWYQTSLGLGLSLARSTRLTGGYEYSQTLHGALASTRRMSFGVSRDLGSDFNLMLRGSQTDYSELNGASERRCYEAEMKLGVRW